MMMAYGSTGDAVPMAIGRKNDLPTAKDRRSWHKNDRQR
jgi:hypothetical protein